MKSGRSKKESRARRRSDAKTAQRTAFSVAFTLPFDASSRGKAKGNSPNSPKCPNRRRKEEDKAIEVKQVAAAVQPVVLAAQPVVEAAHEVKVVQEQPAMLGTEALKEARVNTKPLREVVVVHGRAVAAHDMVAKQLQEGGKALWMIMMIPKHFKTKPSRKRVGKKPNRWRSFS